MSNPIPTKLPEWATDVGADIVEPSQGQKEDGWDVDDKPPSGWMNWRSNLVYQWLNWISSIQAKNLEAVQSSDTVNDILNGVHFSFNRWLAAGTTVGDELQWTKTGEIWQPPSGPIALSYNEIHGNDTHAVACGTGGSLAHATDPEGAWTDNSGGVPGVNKLWALWFAGTDWVLGDEKALIYTATDPTGAFVQNTLPWSNEAGAYIEALRYITRLSLWLAAGHNSTSWDGLATASDPASTWTGRTSPEAFNDFMHIAETSNLVIVGGGVSGAHQLVTSQDLVTWASKTSAAPSGLDEITALAADPFGNILMSMKDGSGGVIFLSRDDCATWEPIHETSGYFYRKGHYSPERGQFMFVGDGFAAKSIRL